MVLLLGACSMTWAGLDSVGGLSGLMAAPPPGFALSPNGSANGSTTYLHLNCTALEESAPGGATRAAAHCLTRGEWRTFFRIYRPPTSPNPNPDPNPDPNPNPNP